MPIHDWTRVEAGTFHDFHQGWTIRLRDALNSGVLPPGYFAMADQKVAGPEPDVIALQSRSVSPTRNSPTSIAVLETPPHAQQVRHAETASDYYARKANRVAVRHARGQVVAIIEIVSPGNKDRKLSLKTFVEKAAEFLHLGVHLLLVDLFPPGRHDPDGIHQAIWDELSDEPFDPRPADKPLTAAAYESGDGLTAYFESLAVGDPLPELPLFLERGYYVRTPLEASYMANWSVVPSEIRELVEVRP